MKERLIAAAVKIAEKTPLNLVTRGAIAKRAKCAPSLVSFYTGTMEELRDAIVARAIEDRNAFVISFAIAANHQGVKNAPAGLVSDAISILRRRATQ